MTVPLGRLIKERTILRGLVTKACNKLEEKMSSVHEQDMNAVIAEVAVLENKVIHLANLDEAIFSEILDEEGNEDKLQIEIEVRDSYQIKFKRLKLILDDLKKSSDNASPKIVLNNDKVARYKLPKLELKKFNGDPLEWLGFWGQFSKIDEDPNLAAEDKFQYLIQATAEGSAPRELVVGYPPTKENYPKAIKSLKERFGQDDLLVEVYVRELLKLVIQNVINAPPLQVIFDKLQTSIRALDSLGVTLDKCAALLFPLVESSLPEEVLRAHRRKDLNTDLTPQGRLTSLINFMKQEIDADLRISMAKSGFGLSEYKEFTPERTPTAVSLHTGDKQKWAENKNKVNCIFCNKSHASKDCYAAQKMSLEDKKKIVVEKAACFVCLKSGHNARKCSVKIECMCCSNRHSILLCPEIHAKKKALSPESDASNVNSSCLISRSIKTPEIFLQTLKVGLKGQRGTKTVRLMFDSGSQRSYISNVLAEEVGCVVVRKEKVAHSLFGGIVTKECCLPCYSGTLINLDINAGYSYPFEALGQNKITDYVTFDDGPWLAELKNLGVEPSDGNGPIDILIGADMAGPLFTGKRQVLSNGLIASETLLGWTIWGRASKITHSNIANVITSLHLISDTLENLWDLDTLGIKDPIETLNKRQIHQRTLSHFLETVKVNSEGRFEIQLPWQENKCLLRPNYQAAWKRLTSITIKLKGKNLLKSYDDVFRDWEQEGVIEEVVKDDGLGHYLAHRPVIKDTSTSTPIRPVFDASAHQIDSPSLNDCLDEGPNLIELIPAVLMRFRERKIGITADIRRAFLQISIREEDRNFLKFLWWYDVEKTVKVYRHTRVVFGVRSSPFLLGAVLNRHLEVVKREKIEESLLEKLSRSFYIDNVATSLDSEEDVKRFIEISKATLATRGFDLRDWVFTDFQSTVRKPMNLLGLLWDPKMDQLSINMNWLKDIDKNIVTKRKVLSIIHRIFDPVGFSAPVTILPKRILRDSWEKKVDWDSEPDEETKNSFLGWLSELTLLEQVKIPRWCGFVSGSNSSLHLFTDASQEAYAAAVFLRTEGPEGIAVSLLQSRVRIAPLKRQEKPVTIPRLELLGATIGARLIASVREALLWPGDPCYMWTDSTTVLYWLRSSEEWSLFIRNRVEEIKRLTDIGCWRYVPGQENPADLPSRGCSINKLLKSKWWEGPQWLKLPADRWPSGEGDIDKSEILSEKVHKRITLTVNDRGNPWYLSRFSKFEKIIKMFAWIHRFIDNSKSHDKNLKKFGALSVDELNKAESTVCRIIQEESFNGIEDPKISSLNPIYDQGVIKIKTKLIFRDDTKNFRFPIVLPASHSGVELLIRDEHTKAGHAGVQILLNRLREKYWILGGRRTIRKVISKCYRCRRFEAKRMASAPAPLPLERVREAAVFEVVGIDLAGPLFLKEENRKTWICLFTCAVFRAVHLELVQYLSTDAFLDAFRRFVARRGRPSIIFSDNGTNFVGAENNFERVDWDRISQYSSAQRIQWNFIPPSSPWWGGWWERLIRIIKTLLRKMLGKASLTYQEMETILCEVEAIVNSRPLTYVSSDAKDLVPISPSMFLQEVREFGTPDCDYLDETKLNRRLRYLQLIRAELRKRFRQEYLGQLAHCWKDQRYQQSIKIDDVVLIENDNAKRLDWLLGRVVELISGRDGVIRLVKLQTQRGIIIRPVQRLYPLEATERTEKKEELPPSEDVLKTRAGRLIKLPARYKT